MTWRSRILWALPVALRLALGAVFAYAGWLKLRDPWQLFAGGIADYKVVPDWALEPLARGLPWVEVAIGALLIVGRWLRTAATACSLLLLVFFALMVRAFSKGMDISCGCFGSARDPISWRTLLRDGSLLAASLAVTWFAFARRRKRVEVKPDVGA